MRPDQSANPGYPQISAPTVDHSAPFDLPMVGRFPEGEAFWRLVQRAIDDSQGQMLLIEGEAGIGKSKFLRFCRAAVASLPVRVLVGAYRPTGVAFAGLREALVELFGGEELESEPVAAAARIAATLPELGYPASVSEAADVARFLTQFLRPMPGLVGEPVGLAGPGAGEELHCYVVARLARFLRRVSLKVPLLLLLEDLHWADAESIDLLHHLTSALATNPARLLIIGTVRAEERAANPALEVAMPQMARFEGTFQCRVLRRLDEAETENLIVAALQAELEDQAAIYALAAGNPLHVLSIVRYLESEGLLERAGAGWRVKYGVRLTGILPPTVREVIGRRVHRFVARDTQGAARRELLAWAAASGPRFDAGVLAEAVQEGATHLCTRLDAHLDALLAAGFLHECPSLPGDALEFDHDLLREVVLADPEEPPVKQGRHRCLAAAKLRRVEQGDRSLLPEVAHHFLEARNWSEAVRYHRAAGDAARDSLAYRDAAGFYETAVRLLKEQTDLSLTTDERAGLYEALAGALAILGRREEELAAWQAAQAEAREDRVRWARTERNVAWLLCLEGQLDEAAAACEEARVVLEAAGAEVDLADVLRTLGVVEIYRGRYEAAMTHLQRSIAIYQRGNHLEGLARCYQYLAVHYQQLGDLEAMLDAVQQSRAISEELGHPISIAKALNNVAWVLILLGRDSEALPLLLRTAETLEQHHIEESLPSVYHSLAQALLKCGRGEEARDYLARGLESARRIGEVRTVADCHRLLARHAASAGQSAEARSQFEEALRVCAGTDFEPQQAQICLEFGEFLCQIGDCDEGIRLCEEALAIRRRLGTEGVTEAEAAIARAREPISAAAHEIRDQVPSTKR